MSSTVTSPSSKQKKSDAPSSPHGLKAKAKAGPPQDGAQQEEDDDDDDSDDEEMGSEEEDDDEEAEDNFEEIDPKAIGSRRTRGIKVDYTSPEALKKAGLDGKEGDDDDDDEDGMKMKE